MTALKYVLITVFAIALIGFIALIVLSNRAEKKRLWGFIDEDGQLVVQIQYDDARDFSNGFAAVSRRDRWGFIDREGQVGVEPKFLSVGDFSRSGRAWAKQTDHKIGYIDSSGRWAVEPGFTIAYGFSEQRAMAGITVGRTSTRISGSTGQSIYSFGLIDFDGEWIVEPLDDSDPRYWSTGGTFSEGLCSVQVDGDQFGYIDTTGTMVIPPIYSTAEEFHDGLALVGLTEGGYQIIDKNGSTVLKLPVSLVSRGEDGFLTIYGSLNDREGAFLAHVDGTVLQGPFKEAGVFAWTRLPVKRDDGWVLIDVSGNQYGEVWDSMESISAGRAAVRRDGRGLLSDGFSGYIDSDGRRVIPPSYNRVGPFVNGRARVAIQQ